MSNKPFDDKYRPKTLDKIIGHEKVVQRLQGIISSKKYPNAMLFVGPSSAGKTTLARAFVASLFGVESVESGNVHDFHELNGADARGIDDVRDLLKVASLKPRIAPRRVFLIDECLAPETLVEVSEGVYKTIQEIVQNKNIETVLSYNLESRQVEEKRILSKSSTTKLEYFEVQLSDGSKFRCSNNHKWWVVNKQKWLRADEIEEGDELAVKP